MGDERVGAAFRAVRIRRRMRQDDVAKRAGVHRATVSRLELGHVGALSVRAIRSIADALDIRIDLVPHWRGGELDRLLNARHSALHEALAEWFLQRHPSWTLAPEVSFSIYGERGIVDVLAWHEASRSLLVIELKTELVDVQEALGTLDRKHRLARQIAAQRDWRPACVGCWLVLASSDLNRRRAAAHELVMRTALPGDGRTIRAWLRRPAGSVTAFSFFANAHPAHAIQKPAGTRRVRRPIRGPDRP